MTASKTMVKTMILVVVSAMAFLSLASVAAAGPSMVIKDVHKLDLDHSAVQDLRNLMDLDVTAIEAAAAPDEGPASSDPTDGDMSGEPEAQPAEPTDEPEDCDDGLADEASDGHEHAVEPSDAGSDEQVPADADEDASSETTTPPSSSATTQSAEPPAHKPHRDHLAYTGGEQVMYLLGGLLIVAAAVGIAFLGRGTKQGQQQ